MGNIIKALELCKWAPSGGNTQPWAIAIEELTDDSLTINLSLSKQCKKNDILMEAYGAGALYSLGTLSQTVKKILSKLGWEISQDQFFTQESAYECCAVLKFVQTQKLSPVWSDIENMLQDRRSNRNLYLRTPLAERTKKDLSNLLSKYPKLKLDIHEATRNKVAGILARIETIRCQNQRMSKEFLSEIHFAPSQTGLPYKTLSQAFWSIAIMKLWKKATWLRFIFFVGGQWIFRYMAVDRPIYHSSALVTIQAQELDHESIYQVGQYLCDSWFLLGEQAYDVQVFGLPIFSLLSLLHPNAKQILSGKDRNILLQTQTELNKLGIDITKPCLMFRCGIAKKEALLTPRKPLNISVFKNSQPQIREQI